MLPFLLPLLTALAPVIAETAADKLLGDNHPMADAAKGLVLDVAEQVIGERISDKTTAEEAALQIKDDPLMKAEFVKLMNERIAAELAAETDRLRAALADVESARQRELALAKMGIHDWRADILALVAVAGTVACVMALMNPGASPARDFIISTGSLLVGKFGTIVDFHFGASSDRGRRS